MNNFVLFSFLSLQDDMNGFSSKVFAIGVEDMGRFEVFEISASQLRHG